MTSEDRESVVEQQWIGMLRSMNGPISETMVRSTEVWARAMESVPAEMLRFTASRMRADADAFQACTHCTSLSDFAEQQRAWFERATQSYMDETSRLMNLSRDVMGASVAETPAGRPQKAGAAARRGEKAGGASQAKSD